MSDPVPYPVRFYEKTATPGPAGNPARALIFVPTPDGQAVSLYKTDAIGRPMPVGGAASSIAATAVVEDTTHRFITDAQIADLANAKRYEHTQSTPSATWTINHNLGFRPFIKTLTVGGVEFAADVTHVSVNQAIVTMTTALAGIALCS